MKALAFHKISNNKDHYYIEESLVKKHMKSFFSKSAVTSRQDKVSAEITIGLLTDINYDVTEDDIPYKIDTANAFINLLIKDAKPLNCFKGNSINTAKKVEKLVFKDGSYEKFDTNFKNLIVRLLKDSCEVSHLTKYDK